MGKIVRQGVEYGGSSNSADCIKYNETKSVKEAIDEIKASSSSNPTAASVTFDNANTGLAAANVQDAVTEVNGKLANISAIYFGTATVTVDSNSKAILTHNLNITGNYFIQVMCTSNLNIVFSYALNKNNLGLIFYGTDMLPIGSGTRTVSYIIIT